MADNSTQPQRFHIERSISFGHILTTMTLIVGATIFFVRQETQIEVLKATVSALEIRMDRETSRTDNALAEIRVTFRRIEDKIDRKADRP